MLHYGTTGRYTMVHYAQLDNALWCTTAQLEDVLSPVFHCAVQSDDMCFCLLWVLLGLSRQIKDKIIVSLEKKVFQLHHVIFEMISMEWQNWSYLSVYYICACYIVFWASYRSSLNITWKTYVMNSLLMQNYDILIRLNLRTVFKKLDGGVLIWFEKSAIWMQSGWEELCVKTRLALLTTDLKVATDKWISCKYWQPINTYFANTGNLKIPILQTLATYNINTCSQIHRVPGTKMTLSCQWSMKRTRLKMGGTEDGGGSE